MVRIEELPPPRTDAPEHAWSLWGADRLGRLEIVDRHDGEDEEVASSPFSPLDAGAAATHCFLQPREAERLVKGLETFELEDVGSSR